MVASVLGNQGCLLANERVEWMIAPSGPGQFVTAGERGYFDCLNLVRGLPRKVNNNYVLNATLNRNLVIDRGTATSIDDIYLVAGQAWTSVTSPVAGTSYVTAFAPGVTAWDRRQQGAVIQWVDAGQYIPPLVANPPGTQQPAAIPLGTPPTSAPNLSVSTLQVTIQAPPSAAVGSDVKFEIEVTNRGTSPATGILVTDRFDAGLQHSVSASPIERDLEDLPPGGSKRFAVTLRLTRPGQLCQTVVVTGAGGIQATARNCITAIGSGGAPPSLVPSPSRPTLDSPPTLQSPPKSSPPSLQQPPTLQPSPPNLQPSPPTLQPSPPTLQPSRPSLDSPPTASQLKFTVRKTGPTRRKVGETAEFFIDVTNTGTTPLTNVKIADNYEASLEATDASPGFSTTTGALVWTVESLAPGQSVRRIVNCRCLREVTRACNRVTVTAAGVSLADDACLEIIGASSGAPSLTPRTQAPPSLASPGQLTISVAETVEPLKVDAETIYSIVVANKSSTSDYQLVVTVTLPPELTLRGAANPPPGKPTFPAGGVQFAPIAEIRAGESLTFEVRAAGKSPGTARLQVEAKSQRQTLGVTQQETTQVIE